MTDSNDHDTLIILAKWAESAERYDDMANYMKKVKLLHSEQHAALHSTACSTTYDTDLSFTVYFTLFMHQVIMKMYSLELK